MADMPDDTTPAPNARDAMPILTIDWELYSEYLADSDLTDEEKHDFIETLWNIVVAFVDLGFGVHPVQQACEPAVAGTAEPCEQASENGIFLPDDLLKSEQDVPHDKTIENAMDKEGS